MITGVVQVDEQPTHGMTVGKIPVRSIIRFSGLALFAAFLLCVSTAAQEAAHPVLTCSISTPEIRAVYPDYRYDPMPFPVTVTVSNTGNVLSDSVFVTIELQGDCSLLGGDSSNTATKTLQKVRLFPGESSLARWLVTHPRTLTEKEYIITVWVKSQNDIADSSMCEVTVKIPPLDSPILAPRCYVPDSLHFDEGLDSYTPNPFTVRLTAYNKGNSEARNVTGTIILPDNVEFDPPGQSETKSFNPSTMPKWNIGDPVPELTWTVRWTKLLRHDSTATISFYVIGCHVEGFMLDTIRSSHTVRIPSPGASFIDMICPQRAGELPTALQLNGDSTDYIPDPLDFSWRLFIRKGVLPEWIRQVRFSFPPSVGLTLDESTPGDRILDTLLRPGDTLRIWYRLHVEPRMQERRVLLKWNMDASDCGWAFSSDHVLSIPAVRTATGTHSSGSPVSASMETPVPHPVQHSSSIQVSLERHLHLRLELLDVLGRRVRLIYEGELPAGRSTHQISARGLIPGIYLLRLSNEHDIISWRRIVVVGK